MAIPNIDWSKHLESHPRNLDRSYLIKECNEHLIHNSNSELAQFLAILNESNFHWELANTLDYDGHWRDDGIRIGMYFYSPEFMRIKTVFNNGFLTYWTDLMNSNHDDIHKPMGFGNLLEDDFNFTNNDRKVLEFINAGLKLTIAENGSLALELDGKSKCYTPEECLKTNRVEFKTLGIDFNLSIVNYQKMIKDSEYFAAAIIDEFKIRGCRKMFGDIGEIYKITDENGGNFNNLWKKFIERISLDDVNEYKDYLERIFKYHNFNCHDNYDQMINRLSKYRYPENSYEVDCNMNVYYREGRTKNGPKTKWVIE